MGLLEQESLVINLVDQFFETMAQLYDDPLSVATVEATLHTLRQGQHPAEDYTVEFCTCSSDSGWNEAALRHQYRLGLSESLKDELSRVETPSTLEGLIQLTIQLDRSLRECQSECIQTFQLPEALLTSNPMQLGLAHPALTSEERQANLCFYCEGTGHFKSFCPIRPRKSAPHTPVNFQVSKSSSTHVIFPVTLQVAGEEVLLQAILDFGGCSCFLDLTLAKRLAIPLHHKRQRLTIHLPRSRHVTQ